MNRHFEKLYYQAPQPNSNILATSKNWKNIGIFNSADFIDPTALINADLNTEKQNALISGKDDVDGSRQIY